MADEQGYAVALVTPERVLVDERATQVVLRTADGDATFLDGHTPLVGAIVPGAVRITDDEGAEHTFAVHGGFVQVEKGAEEGTRVTILSPVAEPAAEIDVARAQAALAAAEARVAELGGVAAAAPHGAEGEGTADPELVEAQAAVERARVRLDVAGVSD